MIYKTIEELTTVVTGGTPSTLKAEYWENGNIPWLQSGCCQNCDVNQADKFISQSGYDNSSTQVMPMNTVMIALTGATAGKVGYLNIEACGNQSITGIFPCEELNPRFLFYFLISQRRKILVDCVGGAQAHISQGYVKKIKVPVYSKNIQERIVNIMNICSKNIKHYEMILKEYDELVKARFIEMFGDPENNPNGWMESPLSEKLSVLGGFAFKSDKFSEISGIPILRIGNINSGHFKPVNMVYWKEDENLERYLIYPGDLVMSLTGTVGKDDYGNVCILGDDFEKYYLNQRNAKLEIQGGINKFYLSQLLTFTQVKKKLTGISRGVRQANISNKDILNLVVPIPPIELQQQFEDFVHQVDKSRFDIKKSIIELEREVVYD